jgi:phosphoribosylformylglycinamidine cyclo-ligase
MLAPIGGFGGLFQLDLSQYRRPVLVSSIDGVGTKLIVATMMAHYDAVGHDIVHHCINDIAVQGAEPLYFLDYFGTGRLRSPQYEQILAGIAAACQAAGCALLGGETAEMPGMYGDDFDLVGVITGVVEKERLITGNKITTDCAVIGLASNGLHTNGYSLARHVLFEKRQYDVEAELKVLGGQSIGLALLQPHTCYWPAIRRALQAELPLYGLAHITGGGVFDNIPRVLPAGLDVIIYKQALPVPPIISLIIEEGQIGETEAYRVFNMGIGMVWMVPAAAAAQAVAIGRETGFRTEICGKVVAGSKKVKLA